MHASAHAQYDNLQCIIFNKGTIKTVSSLLKKKNQTNKQKKNKQTTRVSSLLQNCFFIFVCNFIELKGFTLSMSLVCLSILTQKKVRSCTSNDPCKVQLLIVCKCNGYLLAVF